MSFDHSSQDPTIQSFNEEDFDKKVAQSLQSIHRKVKSKKNDSDYFKWVHNNYDHLQKLYALSGLSLPPYQFFTVVYETRSKGPLIY